MTGVSPRRPLRGVAGAACSAGRLARRAKNRAAENINYPGIKNVWTKPIKMQLPEGYKHIIVMEFESEEVLTKYAAQKKLVRGVHARGTKNGTNA
jgi:hypothetical protein